MIKQGQIYRHFKGHDYQVIGIGVHTETDERVAVYKRVAGPDIIWIRPLAMFEESVVHEGRLQRRFELVVPKVKK